MNKKLLAVAVGSVLAGALSAPTVALAQSSVTISGKFIVTFGQYRLSNRAAAAVGNGSENMVKDESSFIDFAVREDLGGGLAAIGRANLRPSLSDHAVMQANGETWVGLTSKNWGTITLGKHDLHYGNHASFTGVHGGLMTNPTALFDMAGAGAAAPAPQTRTNNSIRYGSPKFGNMFEVVVGYSANPTAASSTPGMTCATTCTAPAATLANQNESDINRAARKGNAWNLAPKLWGSNWEVGYSYWVGKPDAALNTVAGTAPATVVKARGDSLYGWYKWGGLRVGLAWNKSKIDTTTLATGATATTSNRRVWGIPVGYNWGSHNIYFDYYRAAADRATGFAGLDTKARFLGLTYAYDLSKRTSTAVSYNKITNGAAAAYNFFSGAAPQAPAAGEDPRMIGVTLQHRF